LIGSRTPFQVARKAKEEKSPIPKKKRSILLSIGRHYFRKRLLIQGFLAEENALPGNRLFYDEFLFHQNIQDLPMRHLLILPFASMLALNSCAHQPERVFHFQKPLMHTQWDFSLVARSEAQAQKAVDLGCAEIERLDLVLAMWRPESELTAFNAKAGQGPQKVSDDLDAELSMGQKISELSGGASDCTVGPLVKLWYESLKEAQVPAQPQIKEALSHVDYRKLQRLGKNLWSSPAGTITDLGSLAKGYAQDKAAAILKGEGVKSFLMNAGGQVYAAGHKPDGSKWKVGIMNPRDKSKVAAVKELEDQGMSTSGDYEQYTIIHGRRYHHIMDPRSGWPTLSGIASSTVIIALDHGAFPGGWADALDTAALVLGEEKGRSLLEAQQVSGVLIKETNGKLKAILTKDLEGKLDLIL
jgi:thiamine biosynthesis lipoprotein